MKKCTEYTLGKTVVYQGYDPNPDTSYLGEYGEKYKPGCVIRGDRTIYEDHLDDDEYDPPTMDREYSFFYPPDNGEKPGTPEYRKYALQDYDNMEDLNNSQWTYIILSVKTFIHTDTGISDDIQNSLCGIEDHFDKDSDAYKKEIVCDLISENIAELKKMGFSDEEIKESTDNPEYPREW
jgi:hypothetical protein